MPVRCARCAYDLTGLPARIPCPECGSRRRRRYQVHEPGRFRRWPGICAPLGLAIALLALTLAGLRVIPWLHAAIIALESLLLSALAFVNWR